MTSFYHYTRKNLNVNIKTCGSLQKLRNEKLSAKCTIFETLWRHLHVKMTSKWRQNDVIDEFFHNIFFLSKNYHNIPNFAEFNSDSDLIRKLRFKVSSLKDISICLHSSINIQNINLHIHIWYNHMQYLFKCMQAIVFLKT